MVTAGHLIFILFFPYLTIICSTRARSIELSIEKSIAEKWVPLSYVIATKLHSLIDDILPLAMNVSNRLNFTYECRKESLQVFQGVRRFELWALKFIDSSAKNVDGIISGYTASIGIYDQCLNIQIPSKYTHDDKSFMGQYCSVDFSLPTNVLSYLRKIHNNSNEEETIMETLKKLDQLRKDYGGRIIESLRLGICVPSGCTLQDVDKATKALASVLRINGGATRCETRQEKTFTYTEIFIISFYSVTGFLVLVGSLIELSCMRKRLRLNNNLWGILQLFSFIRNVRHLLNTKNTNKMLSCLHGIRFITITWIVFAHLITYTNFRSAESLILQHFLSSFEFQAIVNATFSVDTFFFLGGLLLSYGILNHVKIGNKSLSIIQYVIHRLFRIVPVYIYVLLFIFLLNQIGSGPFWEESKERMNSDWCYKYWWTNLIFVNNFLPFEKMCLSHTWYLAADFQLYIGALIIIIPLIRWPKLGVCLGIIGVMSSITYSGFTVYAKNLLPFLNNEDTTIDDIIAYNEYLFKPFTHIGSYCVGILTGYLLIARPDIKIPRNIQVIGWTLAFLCSSSLIYCPMLWRTGGRPSMLITVTYVSLSRNLWSIAMAWVVVCCARGYGGILNKFLSWKAFIPLGRLTFATYLTHAIIMKMFMASLRTRLSLSYMILVWLFFGFLVSGFLAAFGVSIFVEIPFMKIEKVLLGGSLRKNSVADNCANAKGHTHNFPNDEKHISNISERVINKKLQEIA